MFAIANLKVITKYRYVILFIFLHLSKIGKSPWQIKFNRVSPISFVTWYMFRELTMFISKFTSTILIISDLNT